MDCIVFLRGPHLTAHGATLSINVIIGEITRSPLSSALLVKNTSCFSSDILICEKVRSNSEIRKNRIMIRSHLKRVSVPLWEGQANTSQHMRFGFSDGL